MRKIDTLLHVRVIINSSSHTRGILAFGVGTRGIFYISLFVAITQTSKYIPPTIRSFNGELTEKCLSWHLFLQMHNKLWVLLNELSAAQF